MTLIIPTKIPEVERDAVLAEHAHRFPMPASLNVPGEKRGEVQRLPFILGLPTGACRMPDRARKSTAWQTIVLGLIGGSVELGSVAEDLVLDCLLWPTPRVFTAWRERWPGIVQDLGIAAFRMTGARVQDVFVPDPEGDHPEPIAAALVAHPRAVLRHFNVLGVRLGVVIDAPDQVRFDVFHDGIRRPGEDVAKLARDFADAQTIACVDLATGKPAADAYDRYPAVAVRAALIAHSLVGAIGEARLGEW